MAFKHSPQKGAVPSFRAAANNNTHNSKWLHAPITAHDRHNFFHAVKNNYVHDIKKFIEKYPDAPQLRQDGKTALQEAAARGHVMAMDVLLEAGADPNALSNDRKDSVLMTAAQYNRPEILGKLFHKGGHFYQKLEDGTTLMMRAAAFNSAKTITFLHKRGQIATALNNNGNSALHIAAQHDADEAITALAQGGEDLNQKNATGDTALLMAVKQQKLKSIAALLENRANYKLTDAQGLSAADHARADWLGHPEFLKEFNALLARRQQQDDALYSKGTAQDMKVGKPFTIRPRPPKTPDKQ